MRKGHLFTEYFTGQTYEKHPQMQNYIINIFQFLWKS